MSGGPFEKEQGTLSRPQSAEYAQRQQRRQGCQRAHGARPAVHAWARGVTLTELLAVLALLAALTVLVAPDMARMLRAYRLDTAAGDLYGAIDLTRAQAMARGRRVLLVPLEPGGRNWHQGWVVFVDSDGDRRPTPGDEVIASQGPLHEGIIITARFTSNSVPQYLAYSPSGRSCNAGNGMSARWGTFSLHQQGDIRRIKINMLGRARQCRPDTEGAACAGSEAS